VIEDGGHMMLGHTAEVQAVIKDFLARVIHPDEVTIKPQPEFSGCGFV
jgi:hypothetical protein